MSRPHRVPTIRGRLAVAAAVTLLAGLLLGCGAQPTGPAPVPPGGSRHTTTASGGGSATTAQAALPAWRGARGKPVGITFGNTLFGRPAATVSQILARVRSLGVGWIRIDMSWPDVAPTANNHRSWQALDTEVREAHAHGLRVLGVLAYTPAWARSPHCHAFTCPPRDDGQFAAYAAAVARRYAADGASTFEVWNEPNLGLFWPHPDPLAYRTLLQRSAGAMRAANPRVTVLIGGLATIDDGPRGLAPATFVRRACAGGRCPVTGVAIHPYTFPALPQQHSDPANAWQLMGSTAPGGAGLRSAMRATGLGSRHVWVTEYGAPTRYPGARAAAVSPDRQAATITSGLRLAAADGWIGAYFVDTWQDLSAGGSLASHFGLLDVHGRAKPGYGALRRLLR